MNKIIYGCFATIFLFFSHTLMADSYKLDPVHTQIMFTVNHLGFSNPTGSFVKFDGGFNFDENNFESSSAHVTIQTSSIDMNNAMWNEHLSGPQWFDVAKYPTMEFKSTKVVKTGDKTMDVTGDLTLHGVTKPVTLKVIFNKKGDQMGKQKAGFNATTSIDRTQFGMSTFAPMVGTEVKIHINVEGELVQ